MIMLASDPEPRGQEGLHQVIKKDGSAREGRRVQPEDEPLPVLSNA